MRLRLITTATLVASLALVASAAALVTIYRNDFSRKPDAAEIKRAEGKHCEKGWRRKSKTLQLEAKRGPEHCVYRLPVKGDGPQPDHQLRATVKLLQSTPRRIREDVYLSVSVREGASGYELRLFPKRKEFKLRREPDDAGQDFPVKGDAPKVDTTLSRNKIELRAFNDNVKAWINGEEVADVTDSQPNEIKGRRLTISLGINRKTDRDARGAFDDLKVKLP